MKKTFLKIFVLVYLSYNIAHLSLVKAEYVLPYPSYMPGNTLYRISRIIDTVKNYWYWGTIAQIKYHIGLSDKYLVEGKTLFEYKQYLLATDALRRSDKELSGVLALLAKGVQEGKDMSSQQNILFEAMKMHITTLTRMKGQLPNEFQWTPEKTAPIDLSIGTMLNTSVQIREHLLNKLMGENR